MSCTVGLPRSRIRTWGKFKSAQIVLVQPIIAYNHLTDADDTTCRRLPSFAAISWQMLADAGSCCHLLPACPRSPLFSDYGGFHPTVLLFSMILPEVREASSQLAHACGSKLYSGCAYTFTLHLRMLAYDTQSLVYYSVSPPSKWA